ncbi:uncharacterized protein [Oscarella lobularis]|uniref:uncharacterized protein n=1 Tax=Oscarella lobularis TaxID=121494 RepID=UPI0033142AFB
MTDPYPLLVKALGYFNSTRPGSDKCLYDLLAEHSKKSCRWLVPNSEKSKETSPIAANPTIVREISDVIEETTTSSGSSLKEEGEEEVVELVLPSSSITMAKSDTGNSGGHDDDDEISKFMSEHGLLMVTEEEQEQESSIRDSQLDDDVEEITVPKKRSKIESLSDDDEDDDDKKNEVEEDDEETDSCDDFEGFEANTKQSGTAPVKSGAGRPTKAGPPPLRKIPSFARRISVEKGSATSGGRSSPAGFFQESSYAGNSSRGMSPVEGAAQARRLSQMRKQAVKLSQNSKAPVKK